jgi:hypothetical protein
MRLWDYIFKVILISFVFIYCLKLLSVDFIYGEIFMEKLLGNDRTCLLI